MMLRDADCRDQRKCGAPADMLAEQRDPRYPDHVGDGESREHHRDCLRTLVAGDRVRGHHRPDPEQRAVWQPGEYASGQQHRVALRHCSEEVACGEHGHEPEQDGPSRQPRTGRGEQWRPHDHAEGVTGNQDRRRSESTHRRQPRSRAATPS